jgi:hypothetical protein
MSAVWRELTRSRSPSVGQPPKLASARRGRLGGGRPARGRQLRRMPPRLVAAGGPPSSTFPAAFRARAASKCRGADQLQANARTASSAATLPSFATDAVGERRNDNGTGIARRNRTDIVLIVGTLAPFGTEAGRITNRDRTEPERLSSGAGGVTTPCCVGSLSKSDCPNSRPQRRLIWAVWRIMIRYCLTVKPIT